MIGLLSLNACKSTSVNSFCLWFDPITITQNELDTMSETTLRQIDGVNQEYEAQCNK
jgi:hypothetical protein